MEKYRYALLEQKEVHGNWYFFLNDETEERIGGEYEYKSMIEALNIIGQKGWILVSSVDVEKFIVMKKI